MAPHDDNDGSLGSLFSKRRRVTDVDASDATELPGRTTDAPRRIINPGLLTDEEATVENARRGGSTHSPALQPPRDGVHVDPPSPSSNDRTDGPARSVAFPDGDTTERRRRSRRPAGTNDETVDDSATQDETTLDRVAPDPPTLSGSAPSPTGASDRTAHSEPITTRIDHDRGADIAALFGGDEPTPLPDTLRRDRPRGDRNNQAPPAPLTPAPNGDTPVEPWETAAADWETFPDLQPAADTLEQPDPARSTTGGSEHPGSSGTLTSAADSDGEGNLGLADGGDEDNLDYPFEYGDPIDLGGSGITGAAAPGPRRLSDYIGSLRERDDDPPPAPPSISDDPPAIADVPTPADRSRGADTDRTFAHHPAPGDNGAPSRPAGRLGKLRGLTGRRESAHLDDSTQTPGANDADQLAALLGDNAHADEPPRTDDADDTPIAVSASRGIFGGNSALSLISPNLNPHVDELNDALTAFSALEPGTGGFIRVDFRAFPQFREISGQYLTMLKTGVDTSHKPSVGQTLGRTVRWAFKLFWYHGTAKAQRGMPPPPSPWQKAPVQALRTSDMTDETRQAIRDAEAKSRNACHYETSLSVAIYGPAAEKQLLEQIRGGVEAGFDVYSTQHQRIVWNERSGYDALIGYMPPDQETAFVLSGDELAELASVPDAQTKPQGVLIKRARIKPLPPANPFIIDDPLNPTNGAIPLGLIHKGTDDERVVGMRNSELDQHLYMSGRTGSGKSLDITTPVPTPSGWTTMGEIKQGDRVFDENGKICNVTHAWSVRHNRPCYEVEFNDGSTIIADGEHQWLTTTTVARATAEAPDRPNARAEASVVTTEDILETLTSGDGAGWNHSIDLAEPVQYPEAELPVDPYAMGMALCDGSPRSANAASGQPAPLNPEHHTEGSRTAAGGDPTLDVAGATRIPATYKAASVAQRIALLQGLMDTGGSCDTRGALEFYTHRQLLAEDVHELCCSLGLFARLRMKDPQREVSYEPTYTVSFTAPFPVFRLPRKQTRQALTGEQLPSSRFVVAVRPVRSVPVRCIAVDSPNHLFLVGTSHIPTHNSIAMQWQVHGTIKADYPVVVVDPHGALCDDITRNIVMYAPERLKDVVVVDFGDEMWPIALNPLDISSYDQLEPTVNSVMEMLAKQMSLGGDSAPRAVNYAQQALNVLTEANLYISDPDTKTTMLQVPRFFQDTDFRQLLVNFCSNPSVREAFDPEHGVFEQASPKQQGEYSSPILRAFQPLGNSRSFANVFASPRNKLDFARLVMDKKIILLKLSHFSGQGHLSSFVGSLVIPYLLQSMDTWGRVKDPETGQFNGRGLRLFIDEAPTVCGPGSAAVVVLAQARKWDLGLIAASQFPKQFDRSVEAEFYSNTASKISLALDPDGVGGMARSLSGDKDTITSYDLVGLPNYAAYMNVLMPEPGGGPGKGNSGVFSVATLPPMDTYAPDRTFGPAEKKLREQIVENSRRLICNPRDVIEAKRQVAVDDIRTALTQALTDRAGDIPSLQGRDPSLGGGETEDLSNEDWIDDL